MSRKVFPGGTGVTARTAAQLASDDMILMGTSDEDSSVASAYQTKFSEVESAIETTVEDARWSVGDCLPVAGSEAPANWLMLNGQSVGSEASGATNNDDGFESLFEFLWDKYDDTDCPVSTGRGTSAQADWDDDETIDLPNMTSINNSDLVGIMIYAGAGSGNSDFGGGGE
jgi:hypothetical protein